MVRLVDYKFKIILILTPVQRRLRGARIPIVTLIMKKRMKVRISISI